MKTNWLEKANQEQQKRGEILSFEEYLERLEEYPERLCRTSSLYLRQMIDSFGRNEAGGFNVFQKEHHDSPAIRGQFEAQEAIYQNLNNFIEEGVNNKLILLVGPNGSAKSSIVRKLMKGAEEFSQTDEGILYTFSWVFPIESYVKGTLGINSTSQGKNYISYAHLNDSEISAILSSDLKDNPLLLIPKEYRKEQIESFIESKGLPEDLKKNHLYHGDISARNRMIYDALLKNYKGNHTEVLKHIRVERFFISKEHSKSAVTIEPQMHVDASMQQITMDKRLSSLPPSLQSLNLFSMSGEVIMANRGVLEFSDLLKRPLDAFKYLLMTTETQNINMRGFLTNLDIFFIGSSNEIHLVAFKQHPDFNSFKGRINFIKVPYLTNYLDEKNIYKEQVDTLKDRVHFEPHSLEALSLFSVMTRIRPPQEKNYKDKALGKIASSMSPIEKTLFLSQKEAPDRLSSEEKQILNLGHMEVLQEYMNESLYEGKFGISPRIVKQIIYEISSIHTHVSFVEVLDFLTSFTERKNEYDFLNIPPQGEFNNPIRFLQAIKKICLDTFDEKVRDCLGLVDDRSYESYIERYIQNVTAKIKGEKVKNKITGQFEPSDEYFVKEFEKNIDLKEKPDTFRSHLISQLGAYSLDNPGKKIVYTEVFPTIVRKLQASFREDQKKIIINISKNLVFYKKEILNQDNEDNANQTLMTEENREQIKGIIDQMQEKFKYSRDGAISQLEYLIKERY